MQKIEKVLSRDMALIDMFAWRLGLLDGLHEWLGWSYSDLIFHFHDNYTDIDLISSEHYRKFLDVVLSKIDLNQKWFGTEYADFMNATKKFFDFFAAAKTKMGDKTNSKVLLAIFNEYCSYMKDYFGPFVVMKWLPIWTEGDALYTEKYHPEITLAIEGRTRSEKILALGREFINDVCRLLQKKYNIQPSILPFLTVEEFTNLLENNIVPDGAILNARSRGFIYNNNGLTLTDNDNSLHNFAKLGFNYLAMQVTPETQIKGQVAYRGNVSGAVRLIMTKGEMGSIQEGEILVTSMTTPEYLPAMKTAAAFVTDEGGITCHAAIVAREMKKPCIIGTKIATRTLKTGDRVEINAEKGIVKIV